MSQIFRYHEGPARIPTSLLIDLEQFLDMDYAAPRATVVGLLADVAAAEAAGDIPEHDQHLVNRAEEIHGWLKPAEVDAVQRLRGWHRLRHGTITVRAADLCDVRNLFDTLTFSEPGCWEYLDANGCADPDERQVTWMAITHSELCYRCRQCEAIILRDRIDALLDQQGYVGSPRYQTYCVIPSYDPEQVWRDKVMATPADILARRDCSICDYHQGAAA